MRPGGSPLLTQRLEQGAVRRQNNARIVPQRFLHGLQTALKGEELRRPRKRLGKYPRRLGIAFPAQDLGVTVGFRQNERPFLVRRGTDFRGLQTTTRSKA